MLNQLKYTGIAIFIVTTIVAVLLGFIFKMVAIDNVLLSSASQQSSAIASAYNRVIWDRYYPFISFLNNSNAQQKNTYPQFMSFVNESKAMLEKKDGLVAVKIYSKGNLLWDMNPEVKIDKEEGYTDNWFEKLDSKEALEKASKNGAVSLIIPSVVLEGNGAKASKALIKSFVPLGRGISDPEFTALANLADGMIEISFDITEPLRTINIIQYIIIAVISISFSVVFIIFLRMSQRAETLVEKQNDASIELANAKASAEAESQEKSRFLANVSHELRTPLNAIIGFSEIISSESMGPLNNEHYKGFIKDIHTSSVHLLSLINDILDFSKIEENRFEVASEEVDITKTIMVCMRMMAAKAEELKVNLVDELPKEHIIGMLDAKRIKQVILNLVSNAVKFTPPEGTVKVKCWVDQTNNHVIISISDTGVGMEAQDIAKALTPFKQVDNKLSKQHAGTGLGLPLTKRLVELMKGRFNIMSELGLGTTVTISFPLP
jgi:two-component system cell cycle sensor histidine kinase PleC